MSEFEPSDLFRRIDSTLLTVRISNILEYRQCMVVDGDIALRSEEELTDIPYISTVSLDKIKDYAISRGFSFRPDAQPIQKRLKELYGSVSLSSISSIAIINRYAKRSEVSSLVVCMLFEAGIRTVGELDRISQDEARRLLGQGFGGDLERVVDLFKSLKVFHKQLRE